jgi:hypothetical protein
MNKIVTCVVFALMLLPATVPSFAKAEEDPSCTTLSLVSGPETQFKHLTLDNPGLSSDNTLFELAQPSNAVQVEPTGWAGAWDSSQNDPRVEGATFVSNTELQPATPPSGPDAWNDGSIDQWRLFSDSFTIPDNVTVTEAVVYYTGDDFVNVFLDDSFVATHADFAAVADAQLDVTPGTHELEFVLENNEHPNNGSWNPTGLIYRADITYCASSNPPAATTTTVRIYPTDDGFTFLYDNENQTVWSSARTYTGPLSQTPNTTGAEVAVRSDSQSGKFRIYRSSMLFDTSIIPDSATVESATLNVYKVSTEGNTSLVFTPHTRASNTALMKSDWYLSNYGTEIARGPLIDNTYTTYTFNGTGESHINKAGYTAIGGMSAFDYDNVPQGSSPKTAAFRSSDMSGTSTDPYLEITYLLDQPTNNPPVFTNIGNQTVSENQTLSFTLSAIDPDGDTLTYSAANLPTGATFNPSTHEFSWTPGYSDAGNYENIEFTVTDSGSPMELDVELITITVGDVNRAPEFVSPGAQEVQEDNLLSFTVSASDPDNDAITLSATNLPIGATFNTTTGEFSWTPTLSQEGIYTVTFTATDNGLPVETGTVDVVITVGDNPTPVEQSEDIIEDVIVLDLPTNVENSYMANLQKVATFIEAGNIQAAINQLNAFISKVNQDYNQNEITLQVRDNLVALAEALIGDLQ